MQRKITVLTDGQFRDPARGFFRVRPKSVRDRATKKPVVYRGHRVYRDAAGNQFITI